jgi:hypothetical protein
MKPVNIENTSAGPVVGDSGGMPAVRGTGRCRTVRGGRCGS